MGILNRLGSLLESYIHDGHGRLNAGAEGPDPELEAAYDELNEYLGKGGAAFAGNRGKAAEQPPDFPEEFRADFAELGVPFGSGEKTCKEAYKKLLKIHHPDRHAGHEGNMKKATDKTARVNAAYERIERHRREGRR
ncbi:MAG: J domain-containing protein [Spirochaetaceae bacterium]|jgi:DnaJ-domain-containing protein 1|nr:J domain-containing protein [Spirochaetaceae bacterium]